MSRGSGRVERAVIELLDLNKTMPATILAVLAYQEAEPFRPATSAEAVAVRRALAKLQKRGLVFKLGHLFQGARCSYANRANATAIAYSYVRAFGTSGLRYHPKLAELYADAATG